ncbi:MAG: hypothetical protein IJ137_04960 [Eubacterium sp.]|nr:hypothetical protein [Eubacterium sp.]
MNEKMYHSLSGIGAVGIVTGIICIITGLTVGILSILAGSHALGLKKHIIF